MSQRQNKIWIELATPPKGMDDADERMAFRNKQCALANNLLDRLCKGGKRFEEFIWLSRECRYGLRNLESHSYLSLSDNGHWFSLDYFGRAPDPAPGSWDGVRADLLSLDEARAELSRIAALIEKLESDRNIVAAKAASLAARFKEGDYVMHGWTSAKGLEVKAKLHRVLRIRPQIIGEPAYIGVPINKDGKDSKRDTVTMRHNNFFFTRAATPDELAAHNITQKD